MIDLLSNPALTSIPAALAVIVVVILFLNSQRAYSKTHQDERVETMKLMGEMATSSKSVAEDFTELVRDIQEQRISEQKELLDLYRQQTVFMEKIISKCQR